MVGSNRVNDLRLTIKSDKEVYKVQEPIFIGIKLTNVGKRILKVNTNFVMHTDLECNFTSKVSRKKQFWLPPSFPAEVNERSFVTISPKESIKHRIGYLEGYLSVSQFGHLKTGTYVIKFTYVGRTEDFETKQLFDGWSGSVSSNLIEIKVE